MEKLLCIIVTGLVSLVGVKANCITDLASNSAFTSCLQGLMSATQEMDMQDPQSMCKGNFKQHMLCLSGFIKQCPALSSEGNILQTMKPVLDQFDMICGQDNSGSGSGVGPMSCPGFNQCNHRVQTLGESPAMQPSGNSTPFSLTPYIVYSLCSVYKEQKKCLDGYRSTCPEAVKSSEDALDRALREDKTVNMSMQKMEEIMKNLCPKIPAGFTSNTCVRQKLESPKFVSCILDVKKMSAKVPRDKQCKFYFDGLVCIEENIGKPCGPENAKAIEDSAHLVIHDLPENCDRRIHGVTKSDPDSDKMVNDGPRSGSDSVQSTINFLCLVIFVITLQRLKNVCAILNGFFRVNFMKDFAITG